jgi:hypothetical protein
VANGVKRGHEPQRSERFVDEIREKGTDEKNGGGTTAIPRDSGRENGEREVAER